MPEIRTREGAEERVDGIQDCELRTLPVTKRGVRSAYQRAAASASSSASSRYSSSRVTAGCRVDATACIRPGNGRGGSRVDAIEPRTNLGGPRRLGVGVHLAFEALNQLAGERGSLFVRQSKCFDEELFGVHIERLARHSPPTIGWPFCRAANSRTAVMSSPCR